MIEYENVRKIFFEEEHMTVQLLKMTEEEYIPYLQRSINSYAAENVKSGHWHVSEATKNAEKQFHDLLPEGISTKNNYLFTVTNEENEKIGILWFNVRSKGPQEEAFIYEIEIIEAFRGKGYGKQTMLVLEDKVKEMGLDKISLHVFGHNDRAISLYSKVGYETTSVMMAKKLT